jgi:hypothetical protein
MNRLSVWYLFNRQPLQVVIWPCAAKALATRKAPIKARSANDMLFFPIKAVEFILL